MQVKAFAQGLQDTAVHLPENPKQRSAWLSPLLVGDVNRITAGESTLDVDDWIDHTDFIGFDEVGISTAYRCSVHAYLQMWCAHTCT